jgi:hypothetical protein
MKENKNTIDYFKKSSKILRQLMLKLGIKRSLKNYIVKKKNRFIIQYGFAMRNRTVFILGFLLFKNQESVINTSNAVVIEDDTVISNLIKKQ